MTYEMIKKWSSCHHLLLVYDACSSSLCLTLHIDALSFYWSKMILDRPNHFCEVTIILDRSNLFWSGSNLFGQVQIIRISPQKYNLNLTIMIWTQPKWYGPNQNDCQLTKMIWSVQNHFGPIEGQGMRHERIWWLTNTIHTAQQNKKIQACWQNDWWRTLVFHPPHHLKRLNRICVF